MTPLSVPSILLVHEDESSSTFRAEFIGSGAALARQLCRRIFARFRMLCIQRAKTTWRSGEPISAEEFQERTRHAQELMTEVDPKFDAIVLGPGTSLYYFTGIRWWLSERLLCLVLPRTGEPILISPAFEEGRMRESLRYPAEVRVWQEDASPTKFIAAVLVDRKINNGRIGIEESCRLRFTIIFARARPDARWSPRIR